MTTTTFGRPLSARPTAAAPAGAPVVSASGVTKTYRVYARPWDRLWELVSAGTRHTPVKALGEVSFELRQGESLGIIGENGAGKSTLLSVLAGVITPSAGDLRVRGQTASLLELGMGFHPELTGRQNIRLNAAFQGIDEKQIERLTPEIIEFSELGDFIDRPVKIYSTGMSMRLGFAIAVQVEPEILIVDEALSVGDGYFQKKCMDRLLRFLESGRTLLFCSHALYYVSTFCRRALWLHHGRVEAYGPVDEVVRAYENFLAAKADRQEQMPAIERGPARLGAVRFVGHPEEQGQPVFRPGETWNLEIEWQAESPEMQTQVGVTINTVSDVQVCSFGSHQDGERCFTGARRYRARLSVPDLPLLKGEFSLWVYVLDEVGVHVYDQRLLSAAFSVASPSYRFGLMQMDHTWDGLDSPRGEIPENGQP